MKYMIKCKFCDRTYIVDADILNSDFSCESCGGQNGKEDIIQQIAPVKNNVKNRKKEDEEDPLETIKSFHMSMHPVDEKPYTSDYGNEMTGLFIRGIYSACYFIHNRFNKQYAGCLAE